MNTKDFVLYLHQKGNSPTKIHEILEEEYGSDAMPLSTISYTIRKQTWQKSEKTKPKKIDSMADFKKDHDIELSIKRNPETSIRKISSDTGISPSTVHWILTQRMGYVYKSLTKVPHDLTNEMKNERVECCKLMIDHLKSIKKHHFRFFSTGDESFFFHYTQTGHLWLPEAEPPPEMSTAKFDEKKVMISIFWYPHGIQVIKALLTGEHFNADYFQKEILSDLTRTQGVYQAKYEKQQFYIHFDNARSHKAKYIIAFCKANNLSILPHPPYSPDLAPSDFFLFGYLKDKCRGHKFASVNELIDFINEIFYEIKKEVLFSVFDEWEKRMYKCIDAEGNYF